MTINNTGSTSGLSGLNLANNPAGLTHTICVDCHVEGFATGVNVGQFDAFTGIGLNTTGTITSTQVNVPIMNIIGTSTSSNTIGTGSFTFTTATSLGLSGGAAVVVGAGTSSTPTNYLVGSVTSDSGTSLVISVSAPGAYGSGTFTSWSVGTPVTCGGVAIIGMTDGANNSGNNFVSDGCSNLINPRTILMNNYPFGGHNSIGGYFNSTLFLSGLNLALLNTWPSGHTLTITESGANFSGNGTAKVPHAVTGQWWTHIHNTATSGTLTVEGDTGSIDAGDGNGLQATYLLAAGQSILDIHTDGTNIFGTVVPRQILPGVPTYTAGTNITSCSQSSGYTNSNTRGELTIVGGTGTTGTICTINFSTTLPYAPGMCMVTQNGGTSLYNVGHGTPGTSSVTITAGLTVNGATLTVDYACQP